MANTTCSVDGCDRDKWARGWCDTHYRRWRQHGDLRESEPIVGTVPRPLCSVEGCEKITASGTLCPGHRERLKNTGDVRADEPLGPWARNIGACKVDDCNDPSTKRGLCAMHYRRIALWGETRPDQSKRLWSETGLCLVEQCQAEVHGLGYCDMHYRQIQRYGEIKPTIGSCGRCGAEIDYLERLGARRRSHKLTVCDSCNQRTRKRPPRGTLQKIIKRDGADCALCGKSIDLRLKYPDLGAATIDHIIPWSLRGTNDLKNLQLACHGCNVKRGNRNDAPIQLLLYLET